MDRFSLLDGVDRMNSISNHNRSSIGNFDVSGLPASKKSYPFTAIIVA